MPDPVISKTVWTTQRALAKEIGDERVIPIDIIDDGIVNVLEKMTSASETEIEAKLRKERKAQLMKMQDSLGDIDDIELDLSCPICMELMNTSDNMPIVLSPCGHSICGSCYQSLLKFSSKNCPICRTPIKEGTASQIIKHVVSAIHKNCGNNTNEFQLRHPSSRDGNSPKPHPIDNTRDKYNSSMKREITEKRIKILKEEIESNQRKLDSYSEIEEKYYKAIDAIEDKMKKLERAKATLEREFGETKKRMGETGDKVILLTSVLKKLETQLRKETILSDAMQ